MGKHALLSCVVVVGIAFLYAVQLQNYLLFHSIVEVFSIVIAFAVFIVTWNARTEIENSFIVIVGISYLFVGGLDLLHTIAYEGMGVFTGTGADLPTQLWVSSRYIESISFLGAATAGVVATERQILDLEWNDRQLLALLASYSVVVALALSSIFLFDVFPQAYGARSGLTDFKIFSEYLIIGLFAFGLVLLYRQRTTFNEYVFQLLVSSTLLTMGSELAFTFYVDVYGFSNVVGHIFKVASFYLIYLAVVKTGFTDPQKAIYRELAQRETQARKFKQAADYSGHAILITDREGAIQYVNEAWEDMTGYSAAEAAGETPRILKSGEHEAAFYEELWDTILAGDVWEGNIINERKGRPLRRPSDDCADFSIERGHSGVRCDSR
ncbi:MASE3 domain-containing protein [Haloarculaceae archaeon H-GB2-1]|nr:MASE3 domain-containing protein [Haloarculaceae archaeon H-GB11]MEA5408732.1 MASE3 domain-containing protein [Haloarculaceae archaeon H-GB2-1]